jgi:hypothetical protein
VAVVDVLCVVVVWPWSGAGWVADVLRVVVVFV